MLVICETGQCTTAIRVAVRGAASSVMVLAGTVASATALLKSFRHAYSAALQ